MLKMLYFYLAAFALLSTPARGFAAPAAKPPFELVASIRPLALIASDIAPDFVRVRTLVPAAADPHSYQMKISDRRALADAALLLWLGPDFERFLVGVAPRSGNALAVTTISGLRWPADGHSHHTHFGHHHEHSQATSLASDQTLGRDPHIWLDPENAAAIARALAERLEQHLPDAREDIRARLGQWLARLDRQAELSAKALAPWREAEFGVVHDGFRHFNNAFGLRQAAAVSLVANQRLSARAMTELSRELSGSGCLLAEADTRQAARLAKTLGLPLVVADPLASDPDTLDYPQWLARLTQAFVLCLTQPSR